MTSPAQTAETIVRDLMPSEIILKGSYEALNKQTIVLNLPLSQIEDEFDKADKLDDEVRKAALLSLVLTYLDPTQKEKKAEPLESKLQWFKRLIFAYFIFGGTVNGVVTTFFAIRNLVDKIPLLFGLTAASVPFISLISIPVAVIFAATNFLLFLQFEVAFLKKNLKLTSKKDIEPTLLAHRAQIKMTKLIAMLLLMRGAALNRDEPYPTLLRLKDRFIAAALSKEKKFRDGPPTSTFEKWYGRITFSLGFIMTGAISFFGWSVMIAGGTSAALLAAVSPVGWGFIILGVTTGVAFYTSKRRIAEHPLMALYRTLCGKLNTLKEVFDLHKSAENKLVAERREHKVTQLQIERRYDQIKECRELPKNQSIKRSHCEKERTDKNTRHTKSAGKSH